MADPAFVQGDGWARLRCRVIPRARTACLGGMRNGELVVRLKVPPVDGKANAALRKLIADHFDVTTGQVSIERGGRSRSKTVRIDGATTPSPELRATLFG